MLALADADLLVCSVSSYSAWAAFLSNTPYLWFEPNLQQMDGYYSIWGHEARQQHADGYTRKAIQQSRDIDYTYTPRGLPVSMNGFIPECVFSLLKEKSSYELSRDLINYGVIQLQGIK